ncbi:MAG: 1,6-anhydro-N-acetylmuramyl-L-alanine amidase AmpD [Gammaproteobacteria bacterium]|nr:1,6-anhydro-N-acetylmuramyl-L-alanine amidase AmpD [Gammaproteobacteria bacterium]
MIIDIKTGLLLLAKYAPSPHCNLRPPPQQVDMIVIHGISLPPGQFGKDFIENFFCGKLDTSLDPSFDQISTLKVSAHLLINREGVITQFVPFTQRAWHAGVSSFQGQSNCNDFSVGIELEGTDEVPYEKVQYLQLVKCVQALQAAYPLITRERIVGHSDIAPGRKTDPGASFNWGYFDCLLTSG